MHHFSLVKKFTYKSEIFNTDPISHPSKAISDCVFPEYFATGKNTLNLLKNVTEYTQPKIIIETGVANGVSTKIILNEIKKIGTGLLISIDTDIRAKEILNEQETAGYWKFIHLYGGKKQLRNTFATLQGAVDLFYHDSDHSYDWQFWEFNFAWGLLKPGGILISDDVDSTLAFYEFLKSKAGSKNCVLFDGRKMSGVVQKSHQS